MGGRRTKKITGEKIAQPEEPVKKTKEKPKRKAVRRKKKIRGKRYLAAKEKIEIGKPYPIKEAVKLVKESSYAGFDSSIETHINLGLDMGESDHQIRTVVTLPHGTGRKLKVLVFAKDKAAQAASKAGADKIGDESTIEKIAEGGKVGFDSVVATPEFMPKLAKIARILGPSGLMPSPKSETVTDNPAKVVAELKKGRVELRTEKQPIIHAVIGKVSFPEKNLAENLETIIGELSRVKPSKVKGEYIKSIVLTPTMGPGIKVALDSLE